jgi:hypothetical protein
MDTAKILINLFGFIVDMGGDLDPDHYQLAFRDSGVLKLKIVIKYLASAQVKERELGTIGFSH